MTIREAVEIYNETNQKIKEVNNIVNAIYKLNEKGIKEYEGIDLYKVKKYLNNYMAVLQYDLDQDFAN